MHGFFNPTVGRTADKDNDDEKQDDAEISLGLETRVLLSKGSPSLSVWDCDIMDLFKASLEGEVGKPKRFPPSIEEVERCAGVPYSSELADLIVQFAQRTLHLG